MTIKMGFEDSWRIKETAEFIIENQKKTVALQFPDEYLAGCVLVVEALQNYLHQANHDAQLHILADSVYDQLTVDSIAAKHINTNCLVHYGEASLTANTTISTFYVFPQHDFSIEKFSASLKEFKTKADETQSRIVVFIDPGLQNKSAMVCDAAKVSEADLIVAQLELDSLTFQASNKAEKECSMSGYIWCEAEVEHSYLWIGPTQSEHLFQLQIHLASCSWMIYDTDNNECQTGLLPAVQTVVKKRPFLVEKTKEAQIIGILISSVADQAMLKTAHRVKELAHKADKHTYEIVVAKPTPPKLANFPEVEVFVHICDPCAMILDSKDFLAPLVTPYEAQVAFSAGYLDSLEYHYHLKMTSEESVNMSVVSVTTDNDSVETSLVVRADMKISSNTEHRVFDASDYFVKRREYHGLEKQYDVEASVITEGRCGTASGYFDEM